MESEQEQEPPLHPKSCPLTAETVVGNAAHCSVLIGGSLSSFYTMNGAYNDPNMQIAGSQAGEVFNNNIFEGFQILSEQELIK